MYFYLILLILMKAKNYAFKELKDKNDKEDFVEFLRHQTTAEYGGNQILKGTTFTKYKQFILNCFKICQRQALHAKSLGFSHPTTGKEVNFDSELAEDMEQLIEKWRGYAKHQKEN